MAIGRRFECSGPWVPEPHGVNGVTLGWSAGRLKADDACGVFPVLRFSGCLVCHHPTTAKLNQDWTEKSRFFFLLHACCFATIWRPLSDLGLHTHVQKAGWV